MYVVSWRKILTPSLKEAIGYLVISIGIILSFNISLLFNQLTADIPIDKTEFQQSISEQLTGLSSNNFASTATIILFWSLIGLLVYTVFWLGLNFFTGVKNEVVVETDYVNKASFATRVRIPLIRMFLGCIVLIIIAMSIRVTYPLILDGAQKFFINLQTLDAQTIGLLLISIVGSWFNIYIILSLTKLIFALRD